MKTAGGIAAMGLVLVLVASTGVDRGTTPAAPGVETATPVEVTGGVDEDGLPPRIEYPGKLSYICDEQWNAIDVVPDDPDAHRSADRGCIRQRLALERLELPGGMTVQPGGSFEQEGSNP